MIGGLLFKFKYRQLVIDGINKLKDLIENDIAAGQVSVPEGVTPTEADIASAAIQALPERALHDG